MRTKICILAAAVILLTVMCGNVSAVTVLVDYDGSTLPPSPNWQFVSNGTTSETSQHTVFSSGGTLRMIDAANFRGNSLGYIHPLDFDPNQRISVEFRARVFAGDVSPSSNPDQYDEQRGPFAVWLHDGLVRAEMAVGPDSVTAMGFDGSETIDLLGYTIDGTQWHTYGFDLTPSSIDWYVDGLLIGNGLRSDLVSNVTATDERINMLISSASADVELDYLLVTQMLVPLPPAVLLFGSAVGILGWIRCAKS